MPEESQLIDVAKTFPTLHIDLKYATADNITGRPIYQHAACLLHTDAATALAKAISIAALAGHAAWWNGCSTGSDPPRLTGLGALVSLTVPAAWAAARLLRGQPEQPGIWVLGVLAALAATVAATVAVARTGGTGS